jgi:glycosyltransferase involved in cell wall biosynthesis
MALKCPVITSGIAGMKEQLGDCALFFDPKDENSLIEQLENLKDENLRDELIQKGEILAKSCCVENYISKMMKIIDDFVPIRECWSPVGKYTSL